MSPVSFWILFLDLMRFNKLCHNWLLEIYRFEYEVAPFRVLDF